MGSIKSERLLIKTKGLYFPEILYMYLKTILTLFK